MEQKARTRAQNKYNRKSYDQLLIRVRKDGSDEVTVEEIKHSAEACEESLNQFVLQSIKERMSQLR